MSELYLFVSVFKKFIVKKTFQKDPLNKGEYFFGNTG